MFPTLQDLLGWGPPIDTHSAFVALGMAAAGLVFLVESRRRGHTDPRIPYLVLGALVGRGDRRATRHLGAAPRSQPQNLGLFEQLAYGNASMLSGLVGAWLGVHVAKRIVRYPLRTGDLFAPAVALALAIGRSDASSPSSPARRPAPPGASSWIRMPRPASARRPACRCTRASSTRSPSTPAAFAVLWLWLRHQPIAAGETLTLYIAAYAIFRFSSSSCAATRWSGSA